MAETKYSFPTWQEIEDECRKVSRQIADSGFVPEVVVALSRGGLVPARIICDMLLVKDLVAVKVDHWGITATKDGTAKLRYPVDIDLSGKKVLIVDDITDTGDSISLALDWARKTNPRELKTAVVYHISRSKIIPDFYGGAIGKEDWKWVVWPWNFVEDMCTVLPKELDGRASFSDLKASFEKRHETKIGHEQFRRALDELARRKLAKQNADGTWEKA